MSLVETKKSTVATLRISVAADRLTVDHILAFAAELLAQNVPYDTLIDGSVNFSTLRCTGLSACARSELEI